MWIPLGGGYEGWDEATAAVTPPTRPAPMTTPAAVVPAVPLLPAMPPMMAPALVAMMRPIGTWLGGVSGAMAASDVAV